MPCHVAEVVLFPPSKFLMHTLHYEIPENLSLDAEVGKPVLVPLRKTTKLGFVVARHSHSEIKNLRPISSVVDEPALFDERLVSLCKRMQDASACSFSEALHGALPLGGNIKYLKKVYLCNPDEVRAELARNNGNMREDEKKVLNFLLKNMPPSLSYMGRKLFISNPSAVIRNLEKKALVSSSYHLLVTTKAKRTTAVFPSVYHRQEEAPFLTTEQSAAVGKIKQALAQESEKVFLLFGVTGSGKTEVYFHAMESAKKIGKSCLFLVPEIALSAQLEARLRSRFKDGVAVLHSALTHAQRLKEWLKIKEGQAALVVGARSAVFAPVKNLGLIVMDEEQEHSYKQESAPRYHAREIALMRAENENAVLVLGSATPSVESYYEMMNGHFEKLYLSSRVEGLPMPSMDVVDMRQEWKKGNRSCFSERLLQKIKTALDEKEQVLLFLNRRGYSSNMACRDCGYSYVCTSCCVSLVYHLKENVLRCHYCDATVIPSEKCPVCQGVNFMDKGTGTQRVEAELKRKIPGARILRMDMDTTKRRGSHHAIISAFEKREADVLIGTQMVAKGLDFPGVNLVGVMNADTGIHFPDFRSTERTFHLLMQVAGRAGRKNKQGEVIIQTYNPEHFSITCARDQNYDLFYEKELYARKMLRYPPFSTLVNVVVSAPSFLEAKQQAEKVKKTAVESVRGIYEILGPAPCHLSKIRNQFRYHLLMKLNFASDTVPDMQKLYAAKKNSATTRVVVDVNPVDML